ncbi:MazG family protein [Tepidanaerobacter acetatoxydans Re1]|uniref:MazG family protein n=1 Tax=Tepidanaerobacter acetatoxydans (strain DSM 21804 / JCM 16047 / Re1) TaxID=1209989 RepID=F4LSR8_TEPAE|nr:nucleoside triphosphate pyrophosphohydrolase [Tepidanaerobacter acetatoxydans]AEE90381.1 MazG family protein [Tepidanaerobacter acetatoxydans Re1]CCP24875.1 MazG family protein [Tepidanaerobacter acetatoxydans Re1]
MAKRTLDDLVDIMAKLRGNPGCPWDKSQTHETLKPFLIEEAYEVIDAIDRNNKDDLVEELGDLLLQIVFHSRLAQERGDFDIGDVINGVCNKMVRRHPHIFGDITVDGTEEVLKNWEEIKREEKDMKTEAQSMMNLPKTLPALMKAFKVQEKAARVGFDWDDVKGAFDKVYEELEELKEVYNIGNSDKIREEMGDLIFACVNVARFLEVEPELAVNDAVKKFIRRFDFVETEAAKSDKNLQEMNLQEMDILWEQSKNQEKKL